MDYQKLKYGIFADAPDLLETLPGLGKLKEVCPSYIESAEKAQEKGRWFAREIMLPRVLDTDTKCAKDPAYFDWDYWRIGNRERFTIAGIPEKLGGLGWSALDSFVAMEEMASVCLASTANIVFNTFGFLGALVEQVREFDFAEDASHFLGGREGARHEGGDGVEIELVRVSDARDQVAFLVDHEGAPGLGEFQELLQVLVDLVDVFRVKDESLIPDFR